MTIREAIVRADKRQKNDIDEAQKRKWLSSLDRTIYNNIISTHEDAAVTSFDGYDMETDASTELLAGEPWEDMYIHWLLGWYYLEVNEINSYNASMTLYASVYDDFAASYNRTHFPITTAREVYF